MISRSPKLLELNVWIWPGNRKSVSVVSERLAVDWHPYHDAPVAVEVVAEADIVPLGVEVLILVECRRRLGTADVVLRLVLAPELKEDSAAVILLLRHIEAADVEHAATAGACARNGRREADKRSDSEGPVRRNVAKAAAIRLLKLLSVGNFAV